MKTKLGVTAWQPQPEQALPMPVLADDSASYDAGTVRDVRAWLESVRDLFDARRPSSTLIQLYRNEHNEVRGHVMYGLGLDCIAAGNCGRFRATTLEFCYGKDPVQARYRYLAAIDDSDLAWPLFVVGPLLGVLPGASGDDVVLTQAEQVLLAAS